MMATVNFRVDEALKEKSYSILKEQGIAPTEFFTNILEYIATTGKLPVQRQNCDDGARQRILCHPGLRPNGSKGSECARNGCLATSRGMPAAWPGRLSG